MSHDKESERLARVENNVDWLVKSFEKMEPKIDDFIEKSENRWASNELRWGKVLGVTIAVSFIVSSIIGIAKVLAH